jgi:Flp pilus assembly protein TadG
MRASIRRRRSRGQGLVEFALIFPILILLLVGIFDAGRLIFAYNDITNAAREGTRVGIVDQTAGTIQTEVIRQATSLGLTAAQVDVKFCKSDGTGCSSTKPTTLDSLVQVRVTYPWRAITPIIGNIIGPVTVGSESRMSVERLFP